MLLQFVAYFAGIDQLLLSGSAGDVRELQHLLAVEFPFLPVDQEQFDYARVANMTEHLKRDYSDLVLAHLASVLLSVETTYLLAWSMARS